MNKKSLEHHSPLAYFGVEDHCLLIGGRKFTDILKQHKDVPAYIYDRSVIKQKINSLRKILPESMHIHYAIKANPMPEVVNYTQTLVDGLDVASGQELQVALNSGMDPQEISFAGPGKSIEELTLAVKSGITLNLESETELQRTVKPLAKKQVLTPQVALRINPDFELKTSGMKMSGGP